MSDIDKFYDGDTPVDESEYVDISINNSVNLGNTDNSGTRYDFHDDSFASVGYNYADYEYEDDNGFNALYASRRALSNKLCTISLLLMFAVPIVVGVIVFIAETAGGALTGIFTSINNYSSSASSFGNLFSTGSGIMVQLIGSLTSLSRIAAIVLMIIARVKSPDSTYAKVVMWIYIVLTALMLVSYVLLVVAVIALLIFVFSLI